MYLQLKVEPEVPLEAEVLSPSALAGKTLKEVAALPLLYGNTRVQVGEFFTLSGSLADGHLHLEGDLSRVKYLGSGMEGGLLTITGSVGMHLGAGMSGGEIRVQGPVDDWLGAGMKGGLIRVEGPAGHLVGAGYRGERMGMTGGTIIIGGSAGNEVGVRMRRGLIVVTGDCGDFPGAEMRAGTIMIWGQGAARPGANMRRGTIVLTQSKELLPTFAYSCTYRPVFLSILWRRLEELGLAVPEFLRQGFYERYLGDTNEVGKGEILLCRNTT
jgi:formylmethanofuran dehydrogenase subunit C